jgi:hypothetical protein
MGQIISLPVHATHDPACAAELDTADPVRFAAVRRWVLFVAIRRWVGACRRGEDPIPGLCQVLGTAGAHDAAFSLDGLMSIVAWVVRPPVHTHCARTPNMSHDEKRLLRAVSFARTGDPHLMETVRQAVIEPVSGVTG